MSSGKRGKQMKVKVMDKTIEEERIDDIIQRLKDDIDCNEVSILQIMVGMDRPTLLCHLLDYLGPDLNKKDAESGWTPLHLALYLGYLDAARAILPISDVDSCLDHDGCSALDILALDQPRNISYNMGCNCETYVWGDNRNFTLGHRTTSDRQIPELLEFFSSSDIHISKVSMSPFHSLFLSRCGGVFSCGLGTGGRLGQGRQETAVIQPLRLKPPTPAQLSGLSGNHSISSRSGGSAPMKEIWTDIAVGMDHSMMLTSAGNVYVSGSNAHCQLGFADKSEVVSQPKLLHLTLVRDETVRGICASTYHSIVYTNTTVYTFGLNAGQLGHNMVSQEVHIWRPRPVSALNLPDFGVHLCACSDAASLVVTLAGEVYLLQDYVCRKIGKRRGKPLQIGITGGKLDSSRLNKPNYKGKNLIVILLAENNTLFLWQQSQPVFKRVYCYVSPSRALYCSSFSVWCGGLHMISINGNAYQAAFATCLSLVRGSNTENRTRTKSKRPSDSTPSQNADGKDWLTHTSLDLLTSDDIYHLTVARIPRVHRGVMAVADPEGKRFAVLQATPISNLTQIPEVQVSQMRAQMTELLNNGPLYDVILKTLDGDEILCHKAILASYSTLFARLWTKVGFTPPSFLRPGTPLTNSSEVDCWEITDLKSGEFIRQLVTWMYTDTCLLVQPGTRVKIINSDQREFSPRVEVVTNEESVLQIQDKDIATLVASASQSCDTNPHAAFLALAKRFGVSKLVERLKGLIYNKGCIRHKYCDYTDQYQNSSSMINMRSNFGHLHDVVLKSRDNLTFPAHKCILVGRVDFFRAMFAFSWTESSAQEVSLGETGSVLSSLLHFIYTDQLEPVDVRAMEEKGESYVVHLGCVLAATDVYQMPRLKDLVQEALTSLLTLRNLAEVLELSHYYSANQLTLACHDFLSINLAALLESRCLDSLSDFAMQEAKEYYRQQLPFVARRTCRTREYIDLPSDDELHHLMATHLTTIPSSPMATEPGSFFSFGNSDAPSEPSPSIQQSPSKVGGTSSRKGGHRRKRTSQSRRLSTGSNGGGESDDSSITETISMGTKDHCVSESSSCGEEVEVIGGRIHSLSITELDFPDRENTVENVSVPQLVEDAIEKTFDLVDTMSSVDPSVVKSSLRHIMEEEKESTMNNKQLNESMSNKGKKSSRKLSQREMKQIILLKQTDPIPIQPTPVKLAPWAKSELSSTASIAVTSSDATASSPLASTVLLRDVISSQRREEIESPSLQLNKVPAPPFVTRSPVVTESWADSCFVSLQGPTSSNAPLQSAWGSLGTPVSSEVVTSVRPAPSKSSVEPRQSRTRSFAEIQAEEKKQQLGMQRLRKKPFELIQIEERAMDDLRKRYKADSVPDEYIIVECVPVAMGAPIWRAKSNSTSQYAEVEVS